MKPDFRREPLQAAVVATFGVVGLAACGGGDNVTVSGNFGATSVTISPGGSAAVVCTNLKDATLVSAPTNTKIVFTQLIAATASAPEHCEVKGTINANRVGLDGQHYTIKWHMRLPTQWNGRFYFEGGGGTNGNLGDAYGNSAGSTTALAQRYAVVTQDAGHANASDPDFGVADTVNVTVLYGQTQFAFDPQARLDHGYRSYDWVAQAAKATLQTYYKQGPSHSYFQGCAEGGREGLVLSQRFPEDFDGIVAGNPGMDLPKAGIAEAWDSQQFATVAASLGQLTASGDPFIAKAFTDEQLAAVGNAILQACDVASDGVADGMVLNPEKCTFDPTTLGPSGANVLSITQVTALQKVFAGPKNSGGFDLYAGWFWDPGMAASGWRIWKLGTPVGTANNAINLTLGGSAVPFLFSTPPNRPTHTGQTVTKNADAPDAYTRYILSYDMDFDAVSIFTIANPFSTSANEFMFSSSTDYSRFKAHNSKLVVYSGGADPVFSAKYHINWYQQLMSKYASQGGAQSFARLFVVPGMNHCSGGIATDKFDAFAAVVNWVENGIPPDSIVASAQSSNAALSTLSMPIPATRTRPLCPYPTFAKWTGAANADVNDAKNFICE